jgi:transposase
MKLHGNAALSLNKRRRLARRVVEQGWSLSSAAAAAEVSENTGRKWARRFRAEGEAGCWIARRRRTRSPTPLPRTASR